MTERLTVRLGRRSYWIHFDGDVVGQVKQQVNSLGAVNRRIAVVTDEHLADLHRQTIKAAFGEAPVLVIQAGEQSKNLESFGRILDFLAEHRIDRESAMFAFGGGVVGDLVGFAAASYLRGISYYQIPTTLLAMVDSSVGGKTGLNLKAGKNLVGAFHQPEGVFIGTRLLSSLPMREFAAGMAEVIKYGLLGDETLFADLEKNRMAVHSPHLLRLIRRCCEMKAQIVQSDEFELAPEGGRALLNLGHTFGHAIEQATGYGQYLHGEAVAIGLDAAARLSQKLGMLTAIDIARIEEVILANQLPVKLARPIDRSLLMAAMGRDKKVRAGTPRFVVLDRIGSAVTRSNLDPSIIEEVWREVGAV